MAVGLLHIDRNWLVTGFGVELTKPHWGKWQKSSLFSRLLHPA